MLCRREELEARELAGEVAGQDEAVGAHDQRGTPPAAHAGLGAVGPVVGKHEEDLGALGLPLRLAHHLARVPQGLAGREQCTPIREREALELDVGELEAITVEAASELDELRDPIQVAAMQDHVESEGKIQGSHLSRKGQLAFEARCPRELIGRVGAAVLDGELNAPQPRLVQARQPLPIDGESGRHEVRVEGGGASSGHDLREVPPRRGLAAGEPDVHHAERGSFAEDARPGFRIEGVAYVGVARGVRAVGTAQGAAIGELGDQVVGPGRAHDGDWSTPRRSI
jgi:hypothetical protein